MLKVYTFVPEWGVLDLSPFVCKLLVWLKMAGIPYQTLPGDNRKAPKGKIPYIDDDGHVMGDSALIIEYLKKKHGDRLNDRRFSASDRAVVRAFQSLFETDSYFVAAYLRWWDDADFEAYKPPFKRLANSIGVPGLFFPLMMRLIRSAVKKQLVQQGIAKHSREEIVAIGIAQVDAFADFLGDKPYFMGDEPCTLDATAYGFISNLIWPPFKNGVQTHALGRENLVQYCERIRDRYLKDS